MHTHGNATPIHSTNNILLRCLLGFARSFWSPNSEVLTAYVHIPELWRTPSIASWHEFPILWWQYNPENPGNP